MLAQIGLDQTVPSIALGRQWTATRDAVQRAIARVGDSGWYILGREGERFERAFATFSASAHAIGCANGLDAIEISLRALGLRRGDRVLTTPVSAFATTLAIVRAGGVPVFVDVDASGLLDLDRADAFFAEHADVRWMVPVHLFGHALDLKRLAELRDRYSLRIVEDFAQAHGARSRGAAVGSVGQMAATSFYPTKNVGCIGDGGAVITASDELATRARALRDYGQTAKYVHDVVGLNSRLDELQAAILGDAILPRVAEWTDARRSIAGRYVNGIRHPRLGIPPVPAGSDSVWHLFPVLVDGSRAAFARHLDARGIGHGVHYPGTIPSQRALADAAFMVAGPLTQAERFAAQEISLPIHPFLDDAEVARVIAACNDWRGE